MCPRVSWQKHIGKITTKANRMLGLLQRNLRNCPLRIREQAYISLVRPYLEYCSTVWSPHCKKTSPKSRASNAKLPASSCKDTPKDTSVDSVISMLKELEWKSLEWRRNAASLTMLYKIQHNVVAINPSDYLTPMITSNTRNYHPNKLKTITSRTQLYGNSFFPRTVYLWNSLPVVVLTAPTLEQGRSQPHSPGWARVPLSSFFPQISINFSSHFTYFLPHFGPLGGRVAHLGRPWLRHCPESLQGRSFIQPVISCSVFTCTSTSSSHHLSSPACLRLQHPQFFKFCLLHLYVWSALDQHFCTLGMTSWKDPAEYRRKRFKRKHPYHHAVTLVIITSVSLHYAGPQGLYYTNIYGHERLWLKLWTQGDCSCAILLRGTAPKQNSTIAVTEEPLVLTQRLE